jgi:hypothetical protein
MLNCAKQSDAMPQLGSQRLVDSCDQQICCAPPAGSVRRPLPEAHAELRSCS